MNKPPQNFCMAPWTHTYISPQHERRMCCASREPARGFKQYIDTAEGDNTYRPQSLEEHWNSEHMRSVRRRMLSEEELPECEVCNTKILNTSVYRSYFNQLFLHKYQQVLTSTDTTGHTTMTPVSWDYRFSNLCNFKCRMCGDMLSSAWETENREQGKTEAWMQPDIRRQIQQFTDQVVIKEFVEAIENKTIEEIYWVGGEPLMWDIHWHAMKRIIELGYATRVYPRYNTNLSRVTYQNHNLFDLLKHYRDWQICASIDATGDTGEYIRTGLNYQQWLENFEQGVAIQRNNRQMRIDLTLTLPGMFDLDNIVALADRLQVEILTKVCFAFDSDILMSPMCLPRPLLNNLLDRQLSKLTNSRHRSLKEVLENMYHRPVFAEQWPEQYAAAAQRGKQRLLKLESIRHCNTNMSKILSADAEILAWWESI
jgi:hypothetical protein